MKLLCCACHEPVDRDGADLCDWCEMSPEERKQAERRALVICAVVLALWLVTVYFLSSGKVPSWL